MATLDDVVNVLVDAKEAHAVERREDLEAHAAERKADAAELAADRLRDDAQFTALMSHVSGASSEAAAADSAGRISPGQAPSNHGMTNIDLPNPVSL